ncbi:hypothetical protein [Roseiconus lacunae]|uniref:DUF2157 domain-containing protein n=1 Tax=Roseiconus lacunae TaxID=2605694 RepID=A0ABT7PQG2_9BACT|nr:hypothetical protein [Roseiconus lacunae]MDM4018566.1 hypothetical protein [Roseiconus lacunae]
MNSDSDSSQFNEAASEDPQTPSKVTVDGKQNDKDVESLRQPTTFARLLYNHNPFYLISCLLIIYGCQSLAIGGGDVLEKSSTMAGGLAIYSILMAIVCMGVVCFAKVWDDARSIFIVVIISLVATTTGFDELCIERPTLAIGFALASTGLVLLVTETVLTICRIRLSTWYRLSYYAFFAVLIGFPVILGDAVADRNDSLANWGSVLFSSVVGCCFLLLIPAVRQGAVAVADNGTPWQFPLYPLSAFVVMAVLAIVRSHAIWMSFGFYGTAGNFEPFLTLPIAAAAMILIAEAGLGLKHRLLQHVALVATPLLFFCGQTNSGRTHLPIANELAQYVGGAATASAMVILCLYVYYAVRRIRGALYGIPLVCSIMTIFAPLPVTFVEFGVERWMLFTATGLIWSLMALASRLVEWMWLAHAAMIAVAIVLAGESFGVAMNHWIVAAVYVLVLFLTIGAIFESDLATVLRHVAAAEMVISGAVILFHFLQQSRIELACILFVFAVLMTAYAFLVNRQGWLKIAGIQACLFVGALAFQGHRQGQLYRVNWPIASGVISLGIGLAITTGKSGRYADWLSKRKEDSERPSRLMQLRPGL